METNPEKQRADQQIHKSEGLYSEYNPASAPWELLTDKTLGFFVGGTN